MQNEDRLSIIIPCLDEGGIIRDLLEALQPLRRQGHEILIVDGGSRDDTCIQARPLADQLLSSAPGRARQMNTGAKAANGSIFWFLHADSRLPAGAAQHLLDALRADENCWGRFDVDLSGRRPVLRVVEALMNLRSRLSGIATGDQGIFVRRHAFFAAGGFPNIPLMEDVALSRRLKRLAKPACLRQRLETSSRRWEQAGAMQTILLMWRLRLAFALGADPAKLARRYGKCNTATPES